MIETFVKAELHALTASLSFTKIDFGTDPTGFKRMDRPLYRSLVDYDRAPAGVQFEPSFQILAHPEQEIQIEFQIQQDVPIELKRDGSGGVACLSVNHPNLLLKGLVGNQRFNAKHCRLTWNQSSEDESRKLTVLRLLCVRTDGIPLTNEEEVEGGLYLAIVNRKGGSTVLNPAVKDPGLPSPSTIKIHGIDAQGRPVYDLFKLDQQVPDHLELEPAFRVREGAQVDFKLVLDLPEPYENVVFFPDLHGHVDVSGHNPEERPSQLHRSNFLEANPQQVCELRWVQQTGRSRCTASSEEGKECYCTHGYAGSFHLRSNQWPASLSRFETLLREGNIDQIYVELGPPVADFDPTVIQPPVCTAVNGQTVCTQ